MNTPSYSPEVPVSLDVDKANTDIVNYMERTMKDSRVGQKKLQVRLEITYWLIIVLSVVMFALGIILLSVPAVAAYRGDIEKMNSIIAAGFGIVDLVTLFLSKPIERIRRLMGDMSQLMLALQSYQIQVALRLLEMDLKDRKTIGLASTDIGKTAMESVKMIQQYFEGK